VNNIKILPSSLHVVFSRPSASEVNDQLNFHMIASTYFVNKPYQISYEELYNNIASIGINKLFIFYILDSPQEEIDVTLKTHVFRNNNI